MISRERFEELVKNADKNSIIWGVTDYTCHKNKPELRIEHFELCNMPTFYKNNIDKLFENYNHTEFFETKEAAEWFLEYGNITREEKLSLPSWEEFDCETFISQMGIRYTLIKSKGNRIYLWEGTSMEKLVNEWKTTEENYIDACRLCKKLFLGDSNE